MRRQTVPVVALLTLTLLAGCGKAGSKGGSSSADTSSSGGGKSSTGMSGKTYAPDAKSGKANASSAQDAPLPSPADTSNGKPSAASDAGAIDASKGQAVMNPGAPTPQQPPKQH